MSIPPELQEQIRLEAREIVTTILDLLTTTAAREVADQLDARMFKVNIFTRDASGQLTGERTTFVPRIAFEAIADELNRGPVDITIRRHVDDDTSWAEGMDADDDETPAPTPKPKLRRPII